MNRFLRVCWVLAALCAASFAVDWKALRPQGYLSDFAGVVDAQSRAEIERYCTLVQQRTGAEHPQMISLSCQHADSKETQQRF